MQPRLDVIAEDGSVSPVEDTGFRMTPTAPPSYTPRPNPPTKEIWEIETVHEDDITSKTSSGIRGLNYITIDTAKAKQRRTDDVANNIKTRIEREKEHVSV